MKIGTMQSPLITSENMKKSVMGMDEDGMAYAAYLLRDRNYADKILAVVREYPCNAIDEHIKYEIKTPVQLDLTLTDDDDYEFTIRDYALGLDEDAIRNVFAMYFRSTKSHTNKFIGGIGIGAKAGHCYSDTFFVESFHNGTKTSYACVLGGGDKGGVPVGQVFETAQEPTTEQGIRIVVPVKKEDYQKFHQTILEFIKYNPYNIRYGLVAPNTPVCTLSEGEFTFKFYQDRGYVANTNFKVAMGGVLYTCSLKLAINACDRKAIKSQLVVVADVPVGKLSLPISRENFEDTPANRKYLAKIYDAFKSVQEKAKTSLRECNAGELYVKYRRGHHLGRAATDQFEFTANNVYGDIADFINKASTYNYRFHPRSGKSKSNLHMRHRGKFLVAVLPNNTALRSWGKRMEKFAEISNAAFLGIDQKSLDAIDEESRKEIDRFFEFRLAKKMKSPPLPKKKVTEKTFVIYDRYGRKRSRKTALQLHNSVAKTLRLPEVSSAEEAKKQIKEFKPSTIEELYSFVAALRSDYTARRRGYLYHFMGARALKKELEDEFGWLTMSRADLLRAPMDVRNQKMAEARSVASQINGFPVQFSTITKRILSNVEKANKHKKRLDTMYNLLFATSRDTFKGRITKFIITEKYSRGKLSRADFRQLSLTK